METRANYVVIGGFTLAVVAGMFAFIWWFQRLGTGETKATYEIYFDGPVSGLRRGAGVNFNGIRVGEVDSLALVPDVPRAVVAIIQVAASTPIRTDTRVSLEYQGLTGIATVALTGGDSKAPMLMESKRDNRPPRLVAEPAADAFQAATRLMTRLDKLVQENEMRFSEITADLAKVSRILADNSKDTLLQVRTAAESINKLATDVNAQTTPTLDAIRKLVDNVNAQTGPTLAEYRALATDARNLSADARRAVSEIDRLVRTIERNPRQFLFNNGGTVPRYNR
jgi:phospholipid/cholesterol/gamma-HCH transport system substrate-binding protein